MVKVFLLLGSNLGDRFAYLRQAIAGIAEQIGTVTQQSSVYETQAWGKTDEADYLNQVLLVETTLMADELLHAILDIELQLGRKRIEKWGARTIDIDILFYSDTIINKPDLIIPHPELQNRRFTLEPLAEIAPDMLHPILKMSMLQLKNNLQDCLIVKKL